MRIENLTKSFDGLKALDDVSFSLKHKTITGLIGPNGSGKTTLFNTITGFLRADRGKIYFDDLDIIGLPPYEVSELGIGRLWQDIRLFQKLTVFENVLVSRLHQPGENPLISFFLPKKSRTVENENANKAEEWIEFVGLSDYKHALAEDLSYGQQKLLALARLLASDSTLLLLDEPTAGIHPSFFERIHSLLRKLAENGKSIIIIEHDIRFVSEIAEMVLLMDKGKLLAFETAEKIKGSKILREVFIGL